MSNSTTFTANSFKVAIAGLFLALASLLAHPVVHALPAGPDDHCVLCQTGKDVLNEGNSSAEAITPARTTLLSEFAASNESFSPFDFTSAIRGRAPPSPPDRQL